MQRDDQPPSVASMGESFAPNRSAQARKRDTKRINSERDRWRSNAPSVFPTNTPWNPSLGHRRPHATIAVSHANPALPSQALEGVRGISLTSRSILPRLFLQEKLDCC